MKGWKCVEPDQFLFVDYLPEPELTAGQAIVKIQRIGICGTDYHAFKGVQPFFTYPRVLGHELAGVIEQIDEENAGGLKQGQRVSIIPYMHCGSCMACRNGLTNCCEHMQVLGVHREGGMCERIAVPISHLIAADDLSLDQAAMLEPLAIGAHALRRSGITAGETALVVGAGPIGLGIMELARFMGVHVIAMDVNEDRLAFCQSWAGVKDVIQAGADAASKLAELTNGDRVRFVFDATGNQHAMNGSFQWLGHGGVLTFVGLMKGDITFNDPDFHKRELTLLASRNATRQDFLLVRSALQAGYADISRYVTHRCNYTELETAFMKWLDPSTGVVKAVMEWTE